MRKVVAVLTVALFVAIAVLILVWPDDGIPNRICDDPVVSTRPGCSAPARKE